jgi:two-component system sensor histidine kinase PhoQ
LTRVASVSRKLVLSVAVPLVSFFALTIVVLDMLFRNLATSSLQELLAQQLVAVISAAEPADEGGGLGVRLLDPASRFVTPGSGHYALIRDTRGAVLWSSPSLAGVPLDFGKPVPTGTTALIDRDLSDGTQVRVLSRGLSWEYAPGDNRDLVFSVGESTQPYRAQLWRFRQTMIGWFAGMTLLLLAVLGALLRHTLAPVRRLEHEIREVEAGAREQLGQGYPRELAGTAANLNTLLQSERRRIQRYRNTLGNLAHELKTPLAVMRGALRSDEDIRPGVDREIGRMARIIDHQLSRAATGGATALGQAPVPLAPIARELRGTLLKVHAAKDLSIDLQIEAGACFTGDAGDLTELLGNLLDNACKWCRGAVCLRAVVEAATDGGASLHLTVDDDGPGIDADQRQRVLGRGARADEQTPGHGLGLAMVADTVALYGGSLRIDRAPGLGGARLEVWLPGRRSPAPTS